MIFANTTCKGPSKKGPKGFDVFRLLRKHAVLMHRHIPTAILLLLMIVLFVAMDETLLPQLLRRLRSMWVSPVPLCGRELSWKIFAM